jgi:hypothetical protein
MQTCSETLISPEATRRRYFFDLFSMLSGGEVLLCGQNFILWSCPA